MLRGRQGPPRRNFFLYAAIALLIMMLLNAFVMPMLHGANITEVDYGTFLRMVDGEVEGVTVDTVQIDENGQEIIFSAKDSTGQVSYYSTAESRLRIPEPQIPVLQSGHGQ